MQNVNWRTRRPPSFHHFSNYSTPTYVVVVVLVVIQKSKLHTDSAEVPVLHTPLEVAKVRFSMTCSFVDVFVVFGGFIYLLNSLFTRKQNARERKQADVGISHQTENERENFVYVLAHRRRGPER